MIRRRPLSPHALGRGGVRTDSKFKYQYQCGDCDHVGWSRHKDLASKHIAICECGHAPEFHGGGNPHHKSEAACTVEGCVCQLFEEDYRAKANA